MVKTEVVEEAENAVVLVQADGKMNSLKISFQPVGHDTAKKCCSDTTATVERMDPQRGELEAPRAFRRLNGDGNDTPAFHRNGAAGPTLDNISEPSLEEASALGV